MAKKSPKDQPDETGVESDLVRMVRDPEQYPAPHSADVHPDEVDGFKAAGWRAA